MLCHAMHPMQDYFWKVFHTHGKLICNLYALLRWQNFILVKCGCYINQVGNPFLDPYKYPLPVEIKETHSTCNSPLVKVWFRVEV
jgi:hypothetical protein